MPADDDALAEAAVARSLEEHGAAAGSVVVSRYKRTGSRAVLAAEYVSKRSGALRRGFTGVVYRGGLWRLSGGWSSNRTTDSAQAASGSDDVWLNWGGWSNGDWTVYGGWVADRAAALLRVTDGTGRTEEDVLENGVAILIWDGDLDYEARAELLDAGGDVMRSGLVLRSRPPRSD